MQFDNIKIILKKHIIVVEVTTFEHFTLEIYVRKYNSLGHELSTIYP